MVLQDIFDQLVSGEFRKHALGGSRSASKTISPDDYYVVIPAINLSILELHKRLPLRVDSVTVKEYTNVTMYVLEPKYAESNSSSEPYKYILDSRYMPFKGRVLTIDHVFDMGGHELPLNDNNDLHSLYTPRHNVVQHPYPREGYTFDVKYRTCIDPIPVKLEIDPILVDIDIPEFAMTPLLAHIQSRVDIGMIRGENIQADVQALMRFETACQLIEKQSLIKTDSYTNTHIHDFGWK